MNHRGPVAACVFLAAAAAVSGCASTADGPSDGEDVGAAEDAVSLRPHVVNGVHWARVVGVNGSTVARVWVTESGAIYTQQIGRKTSRNTAHVEVSRKLADGEPRGTWRSHDGQMRGGRRVHVAPGWRCRFNTNEVYTVKFTLDSSDTDKLGTSYFWKDPKFTVHVYCA